MKLRLPDLFAVRVQTKVALGQQTYASHHLYLFLQAYIPIIPSFIKPKKKNCKYMKEEQMTKNTKMLKMKANSQKKQVGL